MRTGSPTSCGLALHTAREIRMVICCRPRDEKEPGSPEPSKWQTGPWHEVSAGADGRGATRSPARDARPRKTATQTVPDPPEPGRLSEGRAGSHVPARRGQQPAGPGGSVPAAPGECHRGGASRPAGHTPYRNPKRGAHFMGTQMQSPGWIYEHRLQRGRSGDALA